MYQIHIHEMWEYLKDREQYHILDTILVHNSTDDVDNLIKEKNLMGTFRAQESH